ncbi:MAG TPA: sigma-70 family RNA polymerase sigma factor [Methylocystis sp.]|nr:sigma-70 family RNA polymerase sigma factor [Methylocystis sp.]
MGKAASDLARRRFRETALPYLDDAYSLARWLVGSGADAEDIVQEACLRALQALEQTHVDQPRAWLLKIVRNTAYSWLAKNRASAIVLAGGAEDVEAQASGLAPTTPGPEAALIEAADRASVAKAIDELPLPFKETLVMREVNGLSYREIAAALGLPVGTVMSRLARARALLVAKLGTPP